MNRRQYIVTGVFGALFCVVTYLGWALLVRPVQAEITLRQADLKAAQDKLQEAQVKAAQHDKFQALAENIRRDLTFISRRVDPTLQTTDLVRMLSSLGSRLSLASYTFETKPRAKSKESGLTAMDEIPVTVKFDAGFHDVGMYLTSLISEGRLIVPERLSLSPMATIDDSRPSVSVEVGMSLILEPKQ